MSTLRSRDYAALFAHHPAMGVYGMLVGWLATARAVAWRSLVVTEHGEFAR